jgi:hypothetical protein
LQKLLPLYILTLDRRISDGKKESRYAAKLRELGFRNTGENTVADDIARAEKLFRRKFNRQERRRAVSRVLKPSFTRETLLDPPITRANDEFGFLWEAPGFIDLTPLGFVDNALWIENHTGIKLPPAPKYS